MARIAHRVRWCQILWPRSARAKAVMCLCRCCNVSVHCVRNYEISHYHRVCVDCMTECTFRSTGKRCPACRSLAPEQDGDAGEDEHKFDQQLVLELKSKEVDYQFFLAHRHLVRWNLLAQAHAHEDNEEDWTEAYLSGPVPQITTRQVHLFFATYVHTSRVSRHFSLYQCNDTGTYAGILDLSLLFFVA